MKVEKLICNFFNEIIPPLWGDKRGVV